MGYINIVNLAEVKRLIIFFFLLCTFTYGYSQFKVVKPVKPKPKSTNFAIGVGLSQSVIYLTRNVNNRNDAKGLNLTMLYGIAKGWRLCGEYSLYRSLDIRPTWYDISAQCFELNLQPYLYFNNNKAYFYPVFGFSYNTFKGFYTGRNDGSIAYQKYEKNSVIKSEWLGFNAGLGAEYFFRPGSVFATYKMRVGKSEGEELNIMDVCMTIGLRFNVKVPTLYRLFKGTRSRYVLDVVEPD